MSVIEAPTEKKSFLESWSTNERMRHVPTLGWMLQKLDGDLRRRIGVLLAPVAGLGSEDPRFATIDQALRSLCRGLDRISEVARQGRGGGNGSHGPQDMRSKIEAALELAVSSLRSADSELIGRRYPVQTFERSKAEPLYAGVLMVIDALDRLTGIVRAVEPQIDERIYEPLVNLQQPLDPRPMA